MLKLKNMDEFSKEVEKIVRKKNVTYLEAVIEHLTLSSIDFDNPKIKNLISPNILKKIYEEAIEYNMFPKKEKR